MPRKLLALALLLAATFLCGFGGPTLVDRPIAPTQRLDLGELQQIVDARTLPEVSAEALLVYDIDAGRMLYERNSDVALPPASLTKLMTALLVLEAGKLDEVVTVQESDLIGDASMGLAVGDQATVETLLWGVLIPSGNDAAMALARHTGGTVENFVARMNARAAELNLAESNFQNPHGLDAADHVTSARDLLALTLANLDYSLFREIVATAETIVDGYPLQSTNQLLDSYAGATGIKTGTTPAAGECLIAQIERDGHPVLIVLLGSGDRYADARALHELYQLNYRWTGGDTLPALNRLVEPTALAMVVERERRGRLGAARTGLGALFSRSLFSRTDVAAEEGDDRLARGEGRADEDRGRLWYLRVEGEGPQTLVRRWGSAGLRPHHRVQLPAPGQPWQAGDVVGRLEWRLDGELVGEQRLVLR